MLRILQSRLATKLVNYYPFGIDDDPEIKGKPWGGKGTARTFRFRITWKQRKDQIVFVKISPIWAKVNPGILEFEALQALYPLFSSSNAGCGVPKPLDFFQDLNAMVMESVGSISLKKYLLKNNSKKISPQTLTQMKTIIGNCGRWLALFHNFTANGTHTQFNVEPFFETFKKEYIALRGLDLLGADIVARIESIEKSFRSINGNWAMPCAMWHCDFTPGHVFVDQDSINVIDILGERDIPIYDDIGKWLASSSAVNAFPSAPFFDYGRMSLEMAQQFMNGYIKTTALAGEYFEHLTTLHRLKHLVLALYSQYSRISEMTHPYLGRLFGFFRLRPIFEQNISYALDNLSKQVS